MDDNLLRDLAYTVVSFPGMRGDSTSIVDSNTLANAFHNQAPGGERVVTVAHNFTAEARDLLGERNAICLSISEFYWSDESWANIRDK